MASKQKKNVKTIDDVGAWVNTYEPKKGTHGKKSNKNRGVQKEFYSKVKYKPYK